MVDFDVFRGVVELQRPVDVFGGRHDRLNVFVDIEAEGVRNLPVHWVFAMATTILPFIDIEGNNLVLKGDCRGEDPNNLRLDDELAQS